MQFEVFTVPAAGGEAMQELNKFLAGHRVVGVEKHLVSSGAAGPAWVFCVEYLQGAVPEGKAGVGSGNMSLTGMKVDYRALLSAEDFAVFSKLREVRKSLAERDGVPPYAIFTNEQLAQVVKEKATTKAALGKIDGIGVGRLEKYGEALLAALAGAAVNTSPAKEVPA